MEFEKILEYDPYVLTKQEKERILTKRLLALTELHREKCPEYAEILDSISYDKKKVSSYRDLPFLPVRLFKNLELKSVPNEDVVKTLTSSGTTGQMVSKIFLNRDTASYQQKAMVKIVSEFTGSSRMPMIIIDCPSVVKDRKKFSARGAGILGFSIFGSKKIYALDDDMNLDVEGIRTFLEKYKGQRILLFGFTFMIWQHFYKELIRVKEETGEVFDLSNAVMIHGGGWKKLVSKAVSPQEFHDCLKRVCGLNEIHDYYGMVEQTGCIYMQCECGHLHASIFSDVIIRNPYDFSECEIGERGIIQVVSTIPESYPGHSLLTEDEGMIVGEDDCPCGRKGKYIKIFGRIKNAEIRGCSDTYAAGFSNQSAGAEQIQFLSGNLENLKEIRNVSPKPPFEEKTCAFLMDLSKALLSDKDASAFADIITLGFWLRKASVNELKQRFGIDRKGELRIGRGVAFHIAPSNVPVNYMYSLVSGLLMGNANVVRIPSKDFPQIRIINAAIERVLEKHKDMRPYIILVRYDRSKEINDYLSELCDVRIIWGGDQTIKELRKSELSPRATEIAFADRYSLAVIDSDAYCAIEDKKKIAKDFYNDTYLTDQNACTSPRIVVWTGSRKSEAKDTFWKELHRVAKEKYVLQSVSCVDKLSQKYIAAVEYGKLCDVLQEDNLIVRIEVEELRSDLMNYRGNCGYFYEYDCDDIMQIRNICNDMHCQTIGYIGNRNMFEPLLSSGIKGVDRVVKIGDTMSFDLVWDGYDLSERLTRRIGIR